MSIYQFNGPRLRCASQLRRRVAYVSRLLTKASTQLCDLKITLAHQVLIAGVELLLHLPVLDLSLCVVITSPFCARSNPLAPTRVSASGTLSSQGPSLRQLPSYPDDHLCVSSLI